MIVDHIGIIVEDIEQTVEKLSALFDLEVEQIQDMPDVGLKVAHIKADNVEIELLQYTGEKPGFAQQVMGPKSGINHISVKVDSLNEALVKMKEAGARLKHGFPRQGSRGVIAFFEPETTGGILFEICERTGAGDRSRGHRK